MDFVRFLRRAQTVIVAVISSNLELGDAPGNVLLRARITGLSRDSVANVSQLLTLDRRFLVEPIGVLTERLMAQVDSGLRRVLGL